jgi:hypothetical protein
MKNRVVIFALLAVALASPWHATTAQAGQYLVRGTFIDPGVLASPESVVKSTEGLVFPSLAMLEEWVKEGKATGGIVVSAKEGVFILNAASNEDVDRMIQGLPFWGLLHWEVTPLIPVGERLKREKEMIAQMKARLGK